MSHKEIAKAFLQTAGMGHAQEAFDRFVAQDFKHHNQYFKGDRQSLLEAMILASTESPNKSIETLHVYEDGDTIITHSRIIRADANAPPIAVVHLFRFEGDKIAELWDIGQIVSTDSPNENGMF